MDPRDAVSVTDNPYWEIVKTIPGGQFARGGWEPRHLNWDALTDKTLGSAEKLAALSLETSRENLVNTYSWSIPDPLTLNFLKEEIDGRVLELGAGRGYWAWQLAQMGVQVEAFDKKEYTSTFHEVHKGGIEAVRASTCETLMLCWPPYGSSMAAEALEAFRGKRLIYVGEGPGGCVADSTFFDKLDEQWHLKALHRNATFEGIRDRVAVWVRNES